MDERLKQLLVLGREHFDRREYDRAERVLRQVLELTDRYADDIGQSFDGLFLGVDNRGKCERQIQ